MNALGNFLRTYFLQVPVEILVSIMRIILMILYLLLLLLILIIGWIIWLYKNRKNTKLFCEKEKKEKCKNYIPESMMRRPDPCIYSQEYLRSQGLPVTWNNPDILMIRADRPVDLANVEADSYHLQEDTDYIVRVRINNSSTILALGVRVRLVYRPWSFNSPEEIPVQRDQQGNEVIRYVNVPPLSGSTNPNDPNDGAFATFKWRTPKVESGHKHFCLQAQIYHPLDTNTGNNMGQENTNVYASDSGHVRRGEVVDFDVPLFNQTADNRNFRFHLDTFNIPDEKITVELQETQGRLKRSTVQKIANTLPNWKSKNNLVGGELSMKNSPDETLTKQRYAGLESYARELAKEKFPLPDGMKVMINGEENTESLLLAANESMKVNFKVTIPADMPIGSNFHLNVLALSEGDKLEGGVSLILNVKE